MHKQDICELNNYEDRKEAYLQNGKYTSDISYGKFSQVGSDFTRGELEGGCPRPQARSLTYIKEK